MQLNQMIKDRIAKWLILLLCFSLLIACAEDGVVGTGSKPKETQTKAQGVAQKGPFAIGSEVHVALASDASNTLLTTHTINSFGEFEFSANRNELYIISIVGHYFNEITGSTSSQPIFINALYMSGSEETDFISINILTHFVTYRTLVLMGQGFRYSDAKDLAQSEVIHAINELIPTEVRLPVDFIKMSVYNTTETDPIANAYLLFFTSVLLQAAQINAELNETDESFEFLALLMQLMVEIVEYTDRFSDETVEKLLHASRKVNPDTIRQNLKNNISGLTYTNPIDSEILSMREPDTSSPPLMSAPPPAPPEPEPPEAPLPPPADIDYYLDTDGDGVVNLADQDKDADGMNDNVDNNRYVFEIFPLENQIINLASNEATQINLNFNRPETIRSYEVVISQLPENGMITQSDILIYTPTPNHTGSDSFSYYVVSEDYTSNEVTVMMNIR